MAKLAFSWFCFILTIVMLPQLTKTNTITRAGMLAILALALIAFLPGSASTPPLDRDEARFATASRQMLETGDFITPRFQHELRAKKPPGIYWMQAASAKALGHDTIFAYRLPSILGAIAVALLGTWFGGRITASPNRALVAGAFMATATVLAAEAHLAKTDAMLAATVLVQQIALWFMVAKSPSPSTSPSLSPRAPLGLAALFWGAMAAGILIKGPIAPVIALFTCAAIAAASRQPVALLKAIRPVTGLGILVATVLPWAVLVSHATDGAFLGLAIRGDLLGKIAAGQESHGAPPGSHLALIMVTFWPGSLLLVRGAIAVWQSRRMKHIIFLLGWLVPFWIAIELTPTKLPHYYLPLMPALAMLASYGIDLKPPAGKPARFAIAAIDAIFMAVSVALGMLVLYAAGLFGDADGHARLWGAIALVFAVSVAALAFWWRFTGKHVILLAVALAGAGFHAATFGGVMPHLDTIHIAPRIKAEIERIHRTAPVDSVTLAGYHEPSAVFALGGEVLLFNAADAALFLGEAPGGLAVVERRALAGFLTAAGNAGLAPVRIATIRGYNISRGRRIELGLWRHDD